MSSVKDRDLFLFSATGQIFLAAEPYIEPSTILRSMVVHYGRGRYSTPHWIKVNVIIIIFTISSIPVALLKIISIKEIKIASGQGLVL